MYQYNELMSTKREQIATRSRKHKDAALHNLHGFIDKELLKSCYKSMKKTSASGVDGQTWEDYGKHLDKNLTLLLEKFRTGKYRAPNIRRTYIPKGKGKLRPLGIPTIEDKVLQSGVKFVLEIIYEQKFKDFSYGFRPGRSQHQAIEALFEQVSYGKCRYIIDADIQNFFGEISHRLLRSFLDKRIKDGVIRKMIDKWLKAGILEEGQLTYPKEGTPQGGVISPLLSNIYLHYVLDKWFSERIQPLLKGRSMIVRYADDFVLGFSDPTDAERVMKVLGKRFAKYGLRLHPDKTKLLDLENREKGGTRGFDFLGFTHYLDKSRKGHKVLKRKTSRKKFNLSLTKVRTWIKLNRHTKLNELIERLNVKLRGYYNYYGITFNFKRLKDFYHLVVKTLAKWLNRRGGFARTWEYYTAVLNEHCTVLKPTIRHSKFKANP